MTEPIAYQIAVLGDSRGRHHSLRSTLQASFADLGIPPERVVFLNKSDLATRSHKAPFACVFFGYEGANNEPHNELSPLLVDSLLILPVVDDLKRFTACTPHNLHHVNGLTASDWSQRCANAILEYFKLLRRERRLFISYKRSDSESIAMQLYEQLDARGYDVFLDTRSVLEGDKFQDELWHRLADSDVMVLLDSPKFKDSQWTMEEYERANDTKLQIVHVLWPSIQPEPIASLSAFVSLVPDSFSTRRQVGKRAKLSSQASVEIAELVESVRARALAARNRALIDACCDLARDMAFKADLQPDLTISVSGKRRDGSPVEVCILPMVGVPSAIRIDRSSRDIPIAASRVYWALYDNRGLLEEISSHLVWLNGSLPITTVSVFELKQALENL